MGVRAGRRRRTLAQAPVELASLGPLRGAGGSGRVVRICICRICRICRWTRNGRICRRSRRTRGGMSRRRRLRRRDGVVAARIGPGLFPPGVFRAGRQLPVLLVGKVLRVGLHRRQPGKEEELRSFGLLVLPPKNHSYSETFKNITKTIQTRKKVGSNGFTVFASKSIAPYFFPRLYCFGNVFEGFWRVHSIWFMATTEWPEVRFNVTLTKLH